MAEDYLEAGMLTDEELERNDLKEAWYKVWNARLECEKQLDGYLQAQRTQLSPSPDLDKGIEKLMREAFLLSVQSRQLEQLLWENRKEATATMFEEPED